MEGMHDCQNLHLYMIYLEGNQAFTTMGLWEVDLSMTAGGIRREGKGRKPRARAKSKEGAFLLHTCEGMVI